MNQKVKDWGLPILCVLLLVAVILIFYFDFRSGKSEFVFAVLDVGQGDALFVQSSTGTQVLIDAGSQNKILSELPKVMPAYDRTIDAIIVTNPDEDHIGGFLDVLRSYKVEYMLEPGTHNESKSYQALKREIERKGIKQMIARRGMRLDLGGGAVIDILFPDRDVSLWTTNDGSMVSKLSYGGLSIMLTGDSTVETEKIILAENSPQYLNSDILKVGHHGSRTSTSRAFIDAVSPEYAIISNGRSNKYGHPHRETLSTLDNHGTEVFRTDLLGAILVRYKGGQPVFSFQK